MKKDKNPSSHLWLMFTIELLLVIGSAVFYKTVERIPEGSIRMTKEELEETKKLKEFSKKYKGCRCSRYCSVWNSDDRDCEIMGEHHLSPSRCRWFLIQELRRGVKESG